LKKTVHNKAYSSTTQAFRSLGGSRRLLFRIDPLFDPLIAYLFLTGLFKPLSYAMAAAVNIEMLYQPIVGYIWQGLDDSLLASSFAYIVLAVGLLALRNRNRGLKLANTCSAGTARQLTVILVLLAAGSIVESRYSDTRYLAAVMTPIFLGWTSVACRHIRFRTILLISAFAFYATLSKWFVILIPFSLTVKASVWLGIILFTIYPLLNQIRFLLIGLALGYSLAESMAFLSIPEFSVLGSLVSIFYRLQSFEGIYLIDSIGLSNVNRNVSAFDLSNFISAQVLDLDYGLAVSFFSQLTFLFSSAWLAAFVLIVAISILALIALPVVRVVPSLSLVFGFYLVIILSDGIVMQRAFYFFVGTLGLVVFLWVSRMRFRFKARKYTDPTYRSAPGHANYSGPNA
tara:strand:- start:6052 stop:7254 length:1203 start_codon:yes stop_codon:yes gene_type:complete